MRTNRIPVPISENVCSGEPIVGRVALEYTQLTFWELSTNPPRTPRVLWSLDDGSIKQVTSRDWINTGLRYPSPYDSGFTNIVFEVSDYFDLNGWRLPKSADLRVYWILNKSPGRRISTIGDLYSGPLSCVVHLRLEAEDAKPLETPIEFPPALPGIALVGDWRFVLSNRPMQVCYLATNRFLSPHEVERIEPYYSTALRTWRSEAMRRPPQPVNRSKKIWYWLATVSLTALFGYWIWVMSKKGQNKQPTT